MNYNMVLITSGGTLIDFVSEPHEAVTTWFVLWKDVVKIFNFVGRHRIDRNMAKVLREKGWLQRRGKK